MTRPKRKRPLHPAVRQASLPKPAPGVRPFSTAHGLHGFAQDTQGINVGVHTSLIFDITAAPANDDGVKLWSVELREDFRAIPVEGGVEGAPTFHVIMEWEGRKSALEACCVRLPELRSMFESMQVLRARMQAAGFDV